LTYVSAGLTQPYVSQDRLKRVSAAFTLLVDALRNRP
jgi:hypothetical protein